MRSIKSVYLYLFLLFITFGFSLTPLSAQIEECDNLNTALIEYGVPKFNYHENRNDIGVFYDFQWEKKNKIVIIRFYRLLASDSPIRTSARSSLSRNFRRFSGEASSVILSGFLSA